MWTPDLNPPDESPAHEQTQQPHPSDARHLNAPDADADAAEMKGPSASPPVPKASPSLPSSFDVKLLAAARRKLDARVAAGDTQIAAAMQSDDERAALRRQGGSSSVDFIRTAFMRYADRQFLATRTEGSGYSTQTFGEVWRRSLALGAALSSAVDASHAAGATPMLRTGDMVGLLGSSSPGWIVSFLASLSLGCVTVPLRSAQLDDDLAYMIQHAEIKLIFVAQEHFEQVKRIAGKCDKMRFIVTIDGEAEDAAAEAAAKASDEAGESPQSSSSASSAAIQVCSLADLQRRGESAVESGWRFPQLPSDPDTLRTLLYTSGSTGRPKAAMYTDRTLLSILSRGRRTWPFLLLHYLPMNHAAGMLGLLVSISCGGMLFFALRNDMSSILEDAQLAQPTVVMLVPRMAELIVEEFEAECSRKGAVEGAERQAVLESFRERILGPRVLWLMVGTAPLSQRTMDFLVRCFGVPVIDGYGQTETGGMVTIDGRILRDVVDEYKILSVPELGYSVDDRPFPRGELLLKCPRIAIAGYFKSEAATAALFDADGFLRTGDIVEERGPDHVVYIDRKSNVLKLAQGEFVSLAHIETTLAAGSPLVHQLFAHAESTQAFVVAVVVPDMSAVRQAMHASADASIDPSDLKSLLLSDLSRVGSACGFQPYEIPREVLVELAAPWSVENELLTESKKLARAKLKAKYKDRIQAIYEEAQHKAHHALQAIKDPSIAMKERAMRCAAVVLGQDVAALRSRAKDSSFRALGGDSVSAVRLHTLLRDSCGASPGVAAILNASATLEQILAVAEITAASSSSSGASTSSVPRLDFASIHSGGDSATIARASDLDLKRFLSAPDADLAPPSIYPKHVLLTGANGFLGRFLLLELCAALAGSVGGDGDWRVTVLVRAASDEKARQRLRDSFGSLVGEFDRFGDRVSVLAGDLMHPRFGLPSGVYDGLCNEVDSILHNAALVNHSLSYGALWEPNVLGTLEIMRFALSRRRKPLTFTSSVAVTWLAAQATTVTEDDTASKLLREVQITNEYAAGYGLSKWASEVQLEQFASAPFSVPVNIVRCSMLLASQERDAQINVQDFISRLIAGVIWTGMRPKTLYASSSDEHGVQAHAHSGRPHLDGLPAEQAAAGIVTSLVHHRAEGVRVFHCVNPLDDGVSIDSLLDCAAEMGYTLETVEPYARWFQQYSAAVQQLPPKIKEQTNATILFQWEKPAANDSGARLMRNDRFNELLMRHTRFKQGVQSLDAAYGHHLIQALFQLGVIPEPRSGKQAQ